MTDQTDLDQTDQTKLDQTCPFGPVVFALQLGRQCPDPLRSSKQLMTETSQNGTAFPPTDARVGVIMGSKNDWETMRAACEILDQLGIKNERTVVSAHRTPDRMFAYARSARDRGLSVIIAGAGGAAHLPGMVASETSLPVIGVPVQSRALSGLDSLLSIVQMPGGIPVATMAIGASGAKNAGLMAARILAIGDQRIREALESFIEEQTLQVLRDTELE